MRPPILHVVFDGEGNRVAEYDYDPATNTPTLLRQYVWLEGRPIAVIENDVVYFVRTDHIGRPVFATDTAGSVVWTASYLPFGGVLTSSGDPINLRFPGQWFQSESGLHQNWMRDYDPTTGRYVQADPLGLVDGASVYNYVRSNPGRYADARGEQTISLGGMSSGPTLGGSYSSRTIDLSGAWQELLNASHKYNPIDLAFQWVIQQCTDDEEDEDCEELHRIDTDTCNGITRVRGARSGAVCHASASERYAACRAGKPIPPLNTWNN